MDPFLAESVRDVVLLMIGGGLTVGGSWFSSVQQSKVREKDREDTLREQAREHIDKAIAAIGDASEAIVSEIVERRFVKGAVVYHGSALGEIRDATVYFPSADLRRASRRATSIVMLLPHQLPVSDDAWQDQHKALSSLRVLLGAYVRGDRALPPGPLEWLERRSMEIPMANVDDD